MNPQALDLIRLSAIFKKVPLLDVMNKEFQTNIKTKPPLTDVEILVRVAQVAYSEQYCVLIKVNHTTTKQREVTREVYIWEKRLDEVLESK